MTQVESKELAALLGEERARLHVPGIVLGLERDGERDVFAEGVADLEDGTPVGPDTAFRIASITKPFVAALAASLADSGLLALDDPLAGDATPRQLLSHQGGLASEWPRPVDRYGVDDGALERLAADEPARLPVGAGDLFSYCNAGYWLVGAAIARATGRTFEDALGTGLLEPLGLRRTGFEPRAPAARGHEQVAPGADEHRPAEDDYPRVRRPSGGLWSTVGDLLGFGAYLAEQETLREPLVLTPEGWWGLGVGLRDVGGRRIVEHAGSAAGFQSLLLLVPDEALALAALTNSGRGFKVIQAALEWLGLYVPPERQPRTADELVQFEGRYRDPWLDARVRAADGGLVLEVTWTDVFKDERVEFPPARAEATGPNAFVVVEGDDEGGIVDFPRRGLGRFGGRVVPRVPD